MSPHQSRSGYHGRKTLCKVSLPWFHHIMIGIIGGIFGGISGALLIGLLNYAQTLREMSPNWIFILPAVGLLIALLRGAPKLLIGSFLTHLGGGSAGREGAAVHLSHLLSEKAAHFLKFEKRQVHRLVVVSMGAAFGAALGAPIAGLIFGFEYNKSRFFRPMVMFHSAIAAVIAQVLVHLSRVPHLHFPEFEIPNYLIRTFGLVLILGILFGFTTAFFHFLKHRCAHTFSKISPLWTGFIGGLTLLALYYFFDLRIYQGLGSGTIIQASQEILPLIMPIKKIIVTVITLGTGFEGGEFFPLAFIGSTMGSSFSFVDPTLTALFAALGFVSAYGTATQTPIACTLLAAELFGWGILPYAGLALWISNRICRRITTRDAL